MDYFVNQELRELREQRNVTLLVTYSLIPLSLATAQHAALFSKYLPSLQDEFQRIEQWSHQPGMNLACVLTASVIYVSGIATRIWDYYDYKINETKTR